MEHLLQHHSGTDFILPFTTGTDLCLTCQCGVSAHVCRDIEIMVEEEEGETVETAEQAETAKVQRN